MLASQRTLFQLTTKKAALKPLTTVRFNSSSIKVHLTNPTNTATTTTATTPKVVDKENEKTFEPERENNRIPFVPVINIPETEFAHHSFFSLYRPLLGLSDEHETPFFSAKTLKTEQEMNQEKADTMLAYYMNQCVPFVDPSEIPAQDGEWIDGFTKAYDQVQQESSNETTGEVSIKVSQEFEDYQELFGEEDVAQENISLDNFNEPLPVFHMPESGEILNYLNTIESNMKQENEKLKALEDSKAVRSKKLEMIAGATLLNNSKSHRFFNSNRNIRQSTRRYQQKWNLK